MSTNPIDERTRSDVYEQRRTNAEIRTASLRLVADMDNLVWRPAQPQEQADG